MKIEDVHPETADEILLSEIAKEIKQISLTTMEILKEMQLKKTKKIKE